MRIGLISSVFLLTFSASIFGQTLNQLPSSVLAVLNKHGIASNNVSVFVQDVSAAQPALLFNADTPRNPASTIKVLTTFAALELLSPAYSWKTEAYLSGNLRNNHLQGDLILKGYGDPFLTVEYFWKFLHDVYDRGVHSIGGDLILDNSYFALNKGDFFDSTPRRAYNAIPSALMVNFQSIGFKLFPMDSKVAVIAEPNPANLTIDNRLRLTGERCNKRSINIAIHSTQTGSKATITGRYPKNCGHRTFYRTALASEQQVYGTFKSLWDEIGGQFNGSLQRQSVAKGRPFYRYTSRPLAELIRGINKYSNNVMTRQLLLTLGAEQLGAPGTLTKGRQAIMQWLQQKGLQFPELVLDNGSGLSRKTRISARSLGHLLLAIEASPYSAELKASLPIAALDGTIKNRLKTLAGRIRVKTGTLTGVKAIAGYVLARNNHTYAVVIMINQSQLSSSAAIEVENKLLNIIHQ